MNLTRLKGIITISAKKAIIYTFLLSFCLLAFAGVLMAEVLPLYLVILLWSPFWILIISVRFPKYLLPILLLLCLLLMSFLDSSRLPFILCLAFIPWLWSRLQTSRARIAVLLVSLLITQLLPTETLANNCLPSTFLWGAASSSHQVEGGLTNSWTTWEDTHAETLAKTAPERYKNLPIWSEISTQAQDPNNYRSDQAADYWDNYAEDNAIAQSLGLNSLRISIEWSRIEPKEGQFSDQALNHYRLILEDMRLRGITPLITLWHWSLPTWVDKQGGWEWNQTPQLFNQYVNKVTKDLGSFSSYWVTLNEPTVYAWQGYIQGNWPPSSKNPISYAKVYRQLIKAQAISYRTIHQNIPSASVGIAHNMWAITNDGSVLAKIESGVSNWWVNKAFLEASLRSQDFIGVNYYFSLRFTDHGTEHPSPLGRSDLGWGLDPDSLLTVLQTASGYGKPIIITEEGLADHYDTHRAKYIEASINAVSTAYNQGINIQGYFYWSLTDNFEWADGFWPRFGLVNINYSDQERTIRSSAQSYAHQITKQSCD